MDTGQSDFTDPPSPRQICFIGSSDVISRIHRVRKGGRVVPDTEGAC